jgi:hypothetical protein
LSISKNKSLVFDNITTGLGTARYAAPE